MPSMTKAECRQIAREKLSALTCEQRIARSKAICEDIIASGILIDKKNILFYMALPNEVDMKVLIDYCVEHNKNVYLPRVNCDYLDVVRYGQGSMVGAYGIEEPIGSAESVILNAVIVPTLGLTRNGDRLGKGKGYYDRLLENIIPLKIAVAFEEQVFDELPTSSHDIKMDKVFIG